MSDEKRTTEPHDPLTRITAAMIDTLIANPEYTEKVRCVVMLNNGDRNGVVLHGYDSDMEAVVDLFLHLRAICRANGKDLLFVPLNQG